jgi:hypothetical protein
VLRLLRPHQRDAERRPMGLMVVWGCENLSCNPVLF